MRAIKTQGMEEIARFATTWSRNSWVSSISRVVMGAFPEFLEPSIAFEVFVEKLTLVFHLVNILCTLSKRLVVGFYSTAIGFNLIRKPSVVQKVFCGHIPICSSILSVDKDRSLRVWNIPLLSTRGFCEVTCCKNTPYLYLAGLYPRIFHWVFGKCRRYWAFLFLFGQNGFSQTRLVLHLFPLSLLKDFLLVSCGCFL